MKEAARLEVLELDEAAGPEEIAGQAALRLEKTAG